MRLQIDIYENEDTEPILSHVFYGATQDRINAVITAHMRYDAFFKAALTTKQFNGMTLRVNQQWLA